MMVLRVTVALAAIAWAVFEGYLSLRRSCEALPRIGLFRGEGDSMEPLLTTPSFLVYTPFPTYEVGDVIVFRSNDSYVIHRIIASTPDGFLTKGDGNDHIDQHDHGPVTEADIIGGVRFVVGPTGVGNPNVRP